MGDMGMLEVWGRGIAAGAGLADGGVDLGAAGGVGAGGVGVG